jgi:hypothetical protein
MTSGQVTAGRGHIVAGLCPICAVGDSKIGRIAEVSDDSTVQTLATFA